MKKKNFYKVCAYALIMVLVSGLFPGTALAEGNTDTTGNESITSNSEDQNTVSDDAAQQAPIVLYELKDEREEKVKHFLMSDHTVQAVMYSEPVHYKEDGEWKDIDNTLSLETAQDQEDFTGYTNNQADFSVKIAENSSEDSLVKIEKDKYLLEFNLVNDNTNGSVNTADKATPNTVDSSNTSDVSYNSEESINTSDTSSNTVDNQTNTHENSVNTVDNTINIVNNSDDSGDNSADTTKESAAELTKAEIKPNEETDNENVFNNSDITTNKAFEVNTISDSVVYEGITDNENTDLEYKVTGSGLKENIVVNQKLDNYQYIFDINADNLQLTLKENEITASDPKTNEVIYIIPVPYMYDANNEMSTAVNYSLEKKETGYQLMVTADENWINKEKTKFPVTIDPVITTKTTQDAIDSTFISSKMPTTNFYEYKMLLAGVDSYAYNKCRTLVKFQLPQLNQGDIVVGAYLNLNQYGVEAYTSTTPNMAVNAYKITSSWNEETVTWNTIPTIDNNETDYSYINRTDGSNLITKTFDITKAVKDWYDGDTPNYGIMLRTNNEETVNTNNSIYAKYWSDKYNDVAEAYPMIVLKYRNTKGLENYYSYTELEAGSAGTAYISNYTGNLYFTQDSISTGGLKMPASVYLTYNTSNSGQNVFNTDQICGYGWKLNIQQYIISSSKLGLSGDALAMYPYVYVDEDGTEHYIQKKVDGTKITYSDEDGLGLTLAKDSQTGIYTLTDTQDNVMTFSSYGNLKSIKDANGNTLAINYDSSNVKSVVDGAGRTITIGNTGSQLTTITDAAGRVTKYTIENGLLTKVTNPDGTYNTYAYDGDKALTSVKDAEGYELRFAYLSKAKGKRIYKAAEYATGSDGTTLAGQKVGFDYSGYNTTKIDSSGVDSIYGNTDDAVTTYQFDDSAHLISTQSMASGKQLGTSLTGYTGTDNLKQANRITSNVSMGSNVNNLLLNHNAETTDNWELLKTGTSTETVGSSTYHYTGAKSLKIGITGAASGSNVRYRQMLSSSEVIPGKTYTFSGYIKTVGLNPLVNGTYGAMLMAICYNADGSSQSFYSDYISSTNDVEINNGWRRESVTFTVPSTATNTSVNLVLKGANGNAYFDALQLEEGNTANSYNFLENASFEKADTLYGFTGSNLNSSVDVTAVQTVFDGKKAFKLEGDKNTAKMLSQEVAISGSESDTYIISGWAKAYSVPAKILDGSNSVNRRFKISVLVTYTDGTSIWKDAAEFNPDITGWQFGAVTIDLSDGNSSTNKTPAKLGIYPRYDYQANSAFFDNFSITKDDVPSYSYDSNGNLISASSSSTQKTSMGYDLNNNLTSTTDAKGNNDGFEYYDNHKIKKTTNQNGVTSNYTYNGTGNQTSQIIKNASSAPSDMWLQTDTAYTDDESYISQTADEDGYITKYSYNETKGLLDSVTDPKAHTIHYSYNNNNDLLTKVTGTVGGEAISNEYEYNKNTLSSISHNGFKYNFFYDTFGNSSEIKVGNNTLASYDYKPANGDLSKVTYGNGDYTTYTYDAYGNIAQEAVNGTPKYKWFADNAGDIIKHEDLQNQLLYNYEYDTSGRLIRQDVVDTSKPSSSQRNAYLTEYSYDLNNNLGKLVNKVGSRTLSSSYTYTLDNLLSNYTMPTGKTVTYSYDSLNRMNKYVINTTAPITVGYTYSSSKRNTDGESKYRTTKVYQETAGNFGTRYSYDFLGNITAISEKQEDGTYKLNNSYVYDELSQLTHEDDIKQDISKDYEYDLAGNIIDVKEYNLTTGELLKTNTYEYTDTNWKDKLTAYNGQGISYDTIGNPTSYLGYNMNWDNGRELSSLSGNGVTASYSYDANGLRATKTVNGIKTTYQYLDGQLLYEKKGSTELNYFYDADGSLKGIQTVDENGTVTHYYVVTNSRGDVIQIYSTIGELSVIYTYDSWGKILSIKDGNGNVITDDNNIGKLNSLRYRSYYYDEEVGLYYLQSRYYNPEIGRFLNADIITGIPGYLITGNMFTYCLNNPINRVDETGLFSFFKNIYLGVGSYFEFQINGSLWNKDSLASISGYLKANITYGYLVVLGISIGSGKYLSSIVSQWFIKNTFLKEIIADAIGITIISNLVYKKLISFLVGRVTSILKTADKYIKKIPYATTTLWKGKIPFDFSI